MYKKLFLLGFQTRFEFKTRTRARTGEISGIWMQFIVPLPCVPEGHVHSKLPSVLVQIPAHGYMWGGLHSSMSEETTQEK